jgi:Ferritin-like
MATGGKPRVVMLLQTAAELEHELSCQYLYAAFTIKSGGDPGLTPSQASRLDQWEQQVTKVAIQEMSHLMMASNLLTALGSDPHLWRPNFPQPATRYSKIGLPSMLAPFTLATASRFMCWEKPDAHGWWQSWCQRVAQGARDGDAAPSDDAEDYGTIGALYDEIRDSLNAHPDWIDPTTVPRQVTSKLIPFTPRVPAVTDATVASQTIDLIVTEGEGISDWESTSHFAYFHQIVEQLSAAGDNPSPFEPAWPTVENPAYVASLAPPGANVIDDPAASALGLLFNDAYRLLMCLLGRLFVSDGESRAERQTLANLALGLMPLVVGRLGTLLTRVPAGSTYPGLYAGPSFELPADGPASLLAVGARSDVWPSLSAGLSRLASQARLLAVEPPSGLAPDIVDGLAIVAKNASKFASLLAPNTVSAG